MQMTPCRTCPLKVGCEIREEKRKALNGLGLSSVKFRCDKLSAALKPGAKVLALLDYVAVGVDPDDCESAATVARAVDAYVMGTARGKVRIYVPYSEEGEDHPEWWLQKRKYATAVGECVHVLSVSPLKIKLTGDHVPACKHCGMPAGFDPIPGWKCRQEYEERGNGYGEFVDVPCEFEAAR